MNQFEEYVREYQKNYQTVGPFYLSDLFKPNGNQNLYKFLKSVYQERFENNFRILVVQDCADVYEYDDLPGQAVIELQKTASDIDISNFFILIISSNKNLEQELEQARKLYSTDQLPMQCHIVDGIEYSKSSKKQDTFCVMPWVHLYVGTDGNVLPCCQADNQFPMGNIKDQSIDSIIKSKSFDALRANMLLGKRSKECSRCYKQEDSGLVSARITHNRSWQNIKLNELDSSGKIQKFQPEYLDIRLNNICNLKCRMCSGYYSSAIAQENAELWNDNKFIELSMESKQRKQSLQEILNYVPYAKKIYFAGGEPLLSAEHYDILDKLIECGNTSVGIFYNTNFTVLKYRNRNVLDLWKHFSNITIGASLDAYGNVAEYVRHGSDWKQIESNLLDLKTHCHHINFTVTSTVGLLNVQSLLDLQKNWVSEKKLNISKFSQSVLISPSHLTLTCLPLDHKKRLENLIEEHIKWCNLNGGSFLASQWQSVLTYMWSEDTSHNLDKFKTLTTATDNHRGLFLAQAIPELKDLL